MTITFTFSLLWRQRNTIVLILISVFCFTILRLLNWLDSNLSEKFKNFHNHEVFEEHNLSADPLAISAHSRMHTLYCKEMLKRQLSSILLDEQWPIAQINNSCEKSFDNKQHKIALGCFHDNRLLTDYLYKFTIKNSPSLCIHTCLKAGFAYAGVKRGVECHCGSSFDVEGSRLLNIDSCKHFVCPNESLLFCGGTEAISIYKTGIRGKRIVNLPEFYPLEHEMNKTYSTMANSSLKILFLLQLNGQNSRQIGRLLRLIYDPKHLYYIHVDSRQHYMYSEMSKIQNDLKARNQHNFHVTKNRFATIWGGTSLLELFLRVIAETKHEFLLSELWNNWDYLLNISESDMPLLSLDELEYNLARNVGMSFLSSHGYNTATFIRKQGFDFYFMECEQRMWRIAARHSFPQKLRLDGGSDWLIIHKDLAEFAISDGELPSQLRLLFTTILLPLESFFHTLAINSDRFCERVLYRNLRFTNWRRKQGCRCETLKPVVDWCGCSPLALREIDIRKIRLATCQSKNLFFGRKFDSLIDVHPINEVEKQVLRFRQAKISSSLINSTWINIYSEAHDNSTKLATKIELLNAIVSLIVDENELLKTSNCKFQRLVHMYIYKENQTSEMQSVITFEVECSIEVYSLFEITIGLTSPIEFDDTDLTIINDDDGSFTFDKHSGIVFGTNFDVKEEIFRFFPPVVDMGLDSFFTLKWHWTQAFPKVNNNYTSPNVELEVRSSNNKIMLRKEIVRYDSVDGNQFLHVFIKQLKNVNAGIWTVSLFTTGSAGTKKGKITQAQFPVFPVIKNFRDLDIETGNLIKKMFSSYLSVKEICAMHRTLVTGSQFFEDCTRERWSSFYLDEVSIFP